VHQLRSEQGCPWDRAQTRRSLLPYLVEETYELAEGIEREDTDSQCSELGDLLYLLLLVVRIAEERGAFDLSEVSRRIVSKMRRRHPGILSPAEGSGFSGAAEEWEAAKALERPVDRSILDGIPKTLPALIHSHRAGEKVSRVGFDWPDLEGVRAKVTEELEELDAAIASRDQAAIHHEYGDLLMAVANLGRFVGVGPEEALRAANQRFDDRFRALEGLARLRRLDLHRADIAQLELLWQEVKASR